MSPKNINYCILLGDTANRMNVHMLRHLTLHVLNWGPLWVYSCFSFESLNGELKKYFHGTRNMSNQVLLFCTDAAVRHAVRVQYNH